MADQWGEHSLGRKQHGYLANLSELRASQSQSKQNRGTLDAGEAHFYLGHSRNTVFRKKTTQICQRPVTSSGQPQLFKSQRVPSECGSIPTTNVFAESILKFTEKGSLCSHKSASFKYAFGKTERRAANTALHTPERRFDTCLKGKGPR